MENHTSTKKIKKIKAFLENQTSQTRKALLENQIFVKKIKLKTILENQTSPTRKALLENQIFVKKTNNVFPHFYTKMYNLAHGRTHS